MADPRLLARAVGGPATLSAYQPTLRDRAANAILKMLGDTHGAQDFVEGLIGSSGLGHGRTSLVDWTPAGAPFAADEAGRKIGSGHPVSGLADLAMTIVPGAVAGRVAKPTAKAGEDVLAHALMAANHPRVAFATHEATPGIMTGHLPDVTTGSTAAKEAFAADPRSSWADAGGNDQIYAAMGIPTRPTSPATGIYTPPGGAMEINPARVSRPLVEMESGISGPQITAAHRSILNTAEATRAYLDAQGAGAWHMPVADAATSSRGSIFVPHRGAMQPEQIAALQAAGEPHGLGDVVDTGQGATMTTFYPNQPPSPADPSAIAAIRRAAPGASPVPARVEGGLDTGYQGFEDAWTQPPGAGAATRQLFAHINAAAPDAPGAAADIDNSAILRALVQGKAQRDAEVAGATGQPIRDDIQNARGIFSAGGLAALKKALEGGAFLPAAALPIAAMASGQGETPPPR